MISKTLKATIKNTIKELKLERDRIIRFIDSMQELLEPSADIPEPKTKRAVKRLKKSLTSKSEPDAEPKAERYTSRKYACMDCRDSDRMYSRGELDQHRWNAHGVQIVKRSKIGRPRKEDKPADVGLS